MKPLQLLAGLAISFFVHSTFAASVNIPSKRPVVTIDVPDSWNPEETDKGIAVESPDEVATVYFEIARSGKGMNSIIDDNIEWLKDQKVDVIGSSKTEKDLIVGGIKSSIMTYDAKSKSYGPSKVGFIFTPIGKALLIITFWITVKDFEKQEPTLDKMLASVRPAK